MNENGPTNLAFHIFKLDKNEVFINIVQLILENEIFYDYFINKDRDRTINLIIKQYSLNKSTANRRASTVKAWVFWCENIIRENSIELEVNDNGLRWFNVRSKWKVSSLWR